MKKKAGLALTLFLAAGLLGGCMTLDYDHDVAVVNTYGSHVSDLHKLTEKYFFLYDHDDPFGY